MWVIRFLTAALPALSVILWGSAGVGLLGFVLLAGGQPARADVIELRASHWCPFSCSPGSPRPGLLVELAREALALFGHEVRYANLSWSRSLAQVQTGAVNGIIGPDLYKINNLIFSAPMILHQESLAFRSGEARPVTGPQDLEGLQLGAVQDYRHAPSLAQYIARHKADPTRVQLLSGEDGAGRNLRKLMSRRIDLVLEERSVLIYTARSLGLSDQIEILPYGEVDALHIGFSPALESSRLYAMQFNAGLAQLQQSGRYQDILASYRQVEATP
jgi:polar amino acid transport system substrate-binding protein